jgi:hypothetical protein
MSLAKEAAILFSKEAVDVWGGKADTRITSKLMPKKKPSARSVVGNVIKGGTTSAQKKKNMDELWKTLGRNPVTGVRV